MLKKIFKHTREGTLWSALKRVLLNRDAPTRRPPHAQYWVCQQKYMSSFEEHEAEIMSGNIPERYNRIAKIVPGDTVLELGAGEGVLSITLAQTKRRVFAIDINPKRHEKALQLKATWKSLGRNVDNVDFILDNLMNRLELLHHVDTVVIVRLLYHLQEDADVILKEISKHTRYVVLVGNADKADLYSKLEQPSKEHSLGAYLYYATVNGMVSALKNNGYQILSVDELGDPIVVGEIDQTKKP